MCGIVGIIGKNSGLYGEADDLFEEMLLVDSIRGMDSTGAFGVTKKNQVTVAKQAVDPGIFFSTNTWKTFKSDINRKCRIVIGHNRKATQGTITSKNAHPFHDKNLTLVHNGYIANHKLLDHTKEVDSETIITALTSQEDYVKGLEKLFGAFAIVWYNHKKKTLYMTRNAERPLYYVHTNEYLFIASEGDMLKWLLKRRNFTFEEPRLITSGTIWEITLDPFTMKENKMEVKTQASSVRQNIVDVFSDWVDVSGLAPTEEIPDLPKPLDCEVKVKELFKEYPNESSILFRPLGFHDMGGHIQVNGWSWMPGRSTNRAVWSVEKSKDKEVYLNAKVPLLANVQGISRRGDEISIILKNVRAPGETFQDWNNQPMSAEEWKAICDDVKCGDCEKFPLSMQPEFSVIGRTLEGTYRVVCATCMDKKTQGAVGPAEAS